MAALTMWDILAGNGQALNAPEQPIYSPPPPPVFEAYSPRPASKPASQTTKTVAELEQEERDRKKAAVEEANTPKSVEERSKELIKNMYGGYNGQFGGRVLTPDEIQFGYTNALGEYRQGRPSLAQLGLTEEEAQRRRFRNLSHEWYESGMDHFEQPWELTDEWDISDNAVAYGNPEWMEKAKQYVNGLAGQNTVSPWLNTFQQDRIGTYNLIKDADYNAFLGAFGERQSNVDGYRDDSIAGWFKNAFAGKDQIRNRSRAITDLRLWNENSDSAGIPNPGVGLNKATDVMTKQYFDQLDLANKYGLTWEQAGAVANQNYNESGGSPVNPGNETVLPGNGMLSHQNSSWMDVLNRGGAPNWDSLLGQYTYNSPLDWASMDNETVESQFSELFDTGGMFTQGKNRDLIYAKLMENMGRV
jgi:hypothetical protein